MANPLSILLGGGSSAHQQREAQITEAAAQQNQPKPPIPQQTPTQAPASMNPATGRPSFINSIATTPPTQQQQASKTLLGA